MRRRNILKHGGTRMSPATGQEFAAGEEGSWLGTVI
jgi:hypothetical protein